MFFLLYLYYKYYLLEKGYLPVNTRTFNIFCFFPRIIIFECKYMNFDFFKFFPRINFFIQILMWSTLKYYYHLWDKGGKSAWHMNNDFRYFPLIFSFFLI